MSALIKPDHHLPNGRFQNPPGSPPEIAHISDFVRFAFKLGWRRLKPVVMPNGHVLPAQRARAGFDQMRGRDCLTWLGHAAFLMRIHQKTLLFDPFLSEAAGPAGRWGPKRFAPPGIPVELLPKIDMLILSHGHYDHLDLATLAQLPNKRDIDVILPLELGKYLRPLGYHRLYELDWYQNVEFGGLQLTALPAVHFSRRGLLDHNRCLWCSYSIKSPSCHVYFSGDTGYGKVFDEIGARIGPFDLAMVGIGAYSPRVLMRPFHAAPEEAIQIGLDIRAQTLVGMHWGTIVLAEEPPFEPPERFRAAGLGAGIPEDQLWLLKIGETRALPNS